MTALGYDDVRRQLAKKLHVDPYSSDPVLTKKLNSVAWVMFSGPPDSRCGDEIWRCRPRSSSRVWSSPTTWSIEKPKGDLIILVQNKLQNFGLSQGEIATFISNSAVPLSLQVSVVEDLEGLGDIPGRKSRGSGSGQHDDGVPGTFPGHFSAHAQSMGPAEESDYRDSAPECWSKDQNGTVIVPAPVDCVSWTPRVAGFVTTPALLAMQNRVLWIPTKMTPLAHQQLVAMAGQSTKAHNRSTGASTGWTPASVEYSGGRQPKAARTKSFNKDRK